MEKCLFFQLKKMKSAYSFEKFLTVKNYMLGNADRFVNLT